MTNQSSRARRRKTSVRGLKFLILSLGMASIIGFWAYFSRQIDFNASADTSLDESGNGGETLADGNAVYLELPPIPTLVPNTMPLNGMEPTGMTMTSTALEPTPAAQEPVKLFLGGSKPNTNFSSKTGRGTGNGGKGGGTTTSSSR